MEQLFNISLHINSSCLGLWSDIRIQQLSYIFMLSTLNSIYADFNTKCLNRLALLKLRHRALQNNQLGSYLAH